MKSSVPIPRSQAETVRGGAAVLGALSQPRRWLSNWLQSQRWEPLTIFRTLFSFEAWCFPSSSEPSHPSTPLSHPPRNTHTHTNTLPLKICCIFVSSSGTLSWCQACVVWSDSHALCGGVEGWMDAQSTIALINTNSHARCSQVSIDSQCSFSSGVIAHFWQLCDSLIPFSVFVRSGKEKQSLTQTAETEGPFSYMRTSLELCFMFVLDIVQ